MIIEETYLPGILFQRTPTTGAVPLVFDIPRSGNEYPHEFHSLAPFDALRRTVSMYVDELYFDAPNHGATWLYALFPNAYIDANRHELDVDPAWFVGDWPVALEPSGKALRGMGLIPRVCGIGDVAMQDKPIDADDLMHRLENYYWPYHNALTAILEGFRRRHDVAFHVKFHVDIENLVQHVLGAAGVQVLIGNVVRVFLLDLYGGHDQLAFLLGGKRTQPTVVTDDVRDSTPTNESTHLEVEADVVVGRRHFVHEPRHEAKPGNVWHQFFVIFHESVRLQCRIAAK